MNTVLLLDYVYLGTTGEAYGGGLLKKVLKEDNTQNPGGKKTICQYAFLKQCSGNL
jgi:hypothetical protein